MPAPPLPSGFSGKPTGEARFREGFRGHLILQWAYKPYMTDDAMGEPPIVWADAPKWALRSIRYHRELRGMDALI